MAGPLVGRFVVVTWGHDPGKQDPTIYRHTHKLHGSAFLGLLNGILGTNHKKELPRSLWVEESEL